MAVTRCVFVGMTSGTATDGGNVTLTINSGLTGGIRAAIAANDFAIAVGATGGAGGTPAWPGGWTERDNGLNSLSTARMVTATRKLDGSETTVQFTGDGAATSSIGAAIYVFANVDETTPLDGVSVTIATGSSTNPNCPSITPGTTGATVVAIAFSRNNDTAITAPTNYVHLMQRASGADTNDVTIGIAHRNDRTGGVAEDPAAFTGWATASWRAISLVLRPATVTIDLVAETEAQSSDSSNVTTANIDTTGANLILLAVSNQQNISVTVSDNKSNTWIPLTSSATTDVRMTLHYAINPTVGTGHNFTVAGTNSLPGIAVQAFSGATGGFDVENGNTAAGASVTTGSIDPTQDEELVVTGVGQAGANAPTITSGFRVTTALGEIGPAWGIGMSWVVMARGASLNPTWSATSATQMAARIAAFKETAASVPFVNYDFKLQPNLRLPTRLELTNLLTTTLVVPQVQSPFANYDFKVQFPRVQIKFDFPNLLATTLAPTLEQAPFINYDFGKLKHPQIARSLEQQNILLTTLSMVQEEPIRNYDFKTRLYPLTNKVFEQQNLLISVLGITPFVNYDFKLPGITRKLAFFGAPNLLTTTLAPTLEQAPFFNVNFQLRSMIYKVPFNLPNILVTLLEPPSPPIITLNPEVRMIARMGKLMGRP